MSEQPPAAARPGQPPKPGAKGKTYAGLSRNQWIIVGAVFAAALGYILWRNHQAKSAQAATNQGSNECTDANGNPVDCGELTADELAALQNELDGIMSQGGGGSGGGGSTGTGTGTVNPGGPIQPGPAVMPTGVNPGGTVTTIGGHTPPPAPKPGGPPKPGAPPTPQNVHATKVTSSSITVAWNRAAGATSYQIRVTYQSQLVKHQSTASTTATISGLSANHTYGVHVASVGPGGTSPEGDTDIKTSG